MKTITYDLSVNELRLLQALRERVSSGGELNDGQTGLLNELEKQLELQNKSNKNS